MFNLAKRNSIIYFRNKRLVLTSLVGALIVIVLYVIFLGNNLKAHYSQYTELSQIDYLMNSWAMAGLISVVSVTTTLGSLSVMLLDRTTSRNKDFLSSPIKSWTLGAGYILSTYFVGVIMTVATLIVSEIYILCTGGQLLSISSLLEVLLIIMLTVLTASSITFFIVSLVRNADIFPTVSTIIGASVGFLAGIYIPIGDFPKGVQAAIQLFPISHGALLLRQVMMNAPMKAVFNGTSANTLSAFQQRMGVVYWLGNTTESLLLHIVYMVGTAILLYGLALFISSKKQKEF